MYCIAGRSKKGRTYHDGTNRQAATTQQGHMSNLITIITLSLSRGTHSPGIVCITPSTRQLVLYNFDGKRELARQVMASTTWRAEEGGDVEIGKYLAELCEQIPLECFAIIKHCNEIGAKTTRIDVLPEHNKGRKLLEAIGYTGGSLGTQRYHATCILITYGVGSQRERECVCVCLLRVRLSDRVHDLWCRQIQYRSPGAARCDNHSTNIICIMQHNNNNKVMTMIIINDLEAIVYSIVIMIERKRQL
jgi:hypothetical protein